MVSSVVVLAAAFVVVVAVACVAVVAACMVACVAVVVAFGKCIGCCDGCVCWYPKGGIQVSMVAVGAHPGRQQSLNRRKKQVRLIAVGRIGRADAVIGWLTKLRKLHHDGAHVHSVLIWNSMRTTCFQIRVCNPTRSCRMFSCVRVTST